MMNVREFGASGDGRSDDPEATQRAVNEGGPVVFAGGDCVIS